MTLPNGPYLGVVDRFEVTDEEESAVVILERDDTEMGEVLVDRERLPQRAKRQDAIVRVVLRDGDVAALWFDARATRKRGASAQARFDRLARRAPRKEQGEGQKKGQRGTEREGQGGGDGGTEGGREDANQSDSDDEEKDTDRKKYDTEE